MVYHFQTNQHSGMIHEKHHLGLNVTSLSGV